MSNQPTPPSFRVFLIELWDNGKIVCPSLPPIKPEQTITTQELTKIRDYINLMIANPDNFHVVRPVQKLTSSRIAELMAPNKIYCKVCNRQLINVTNTERENKLCFDCEKKGILAAVNKDITKPCRICNIPVRGHTGTAGNDICYICEANELKINLSNNLANGFVEADNAILNQPIGEITKEQRVILDKIGTRKQICCICKEPTTATKQHCGVFYCTDHYSIITSPNTVVKKTCNYCQLEINPDTSPRDYKNGVHNRCLKSYLPSNKKPSSFA